MAWAAAAYVISSSIDRWFGVRVDGALEQSGEIAEGYYEATASNALFFGDRIAEQIVARELMHTPLKAGSVESRRDMDAFIRERQRDYNLGVVEFFDAAGNTLVSAVNPEIPATNFTSSHSDLVLSALNGDVGWRVEEFGTGTVIRAAVPIRARGQTGANLGAVVVNAFTPFLQARGIAMIRATLDEYRSLQP